MKEYKTEHKNFTVETTQSDEGKVYAHVEKDGLWANSTASFENHTQAVAHAKKAIDSGEIDAAFQGY